METNAKRTDHTVSVGLWCGRGKSHVKPSAVRQNGPKPYALELTQDDEVLGTPGQHFWRLQVLFGKIGTSKT